MAKQIKIKLVKSPIGRIPKHRKTVRALGLRKMNQTTVKDVSPAVMGMINSVAYLLEVEEIK